MRRNRASGHTHLWTEHLQAWLGETYPAETSTEPPNPTRWLKLVELIQFMWENRYIPTKLGWTMLVLIPKVNMDNPGVVLVEVVWRVVEAVIDTQIKKVIQLQDVLHGF